MTPTTDIERGLIADIIHYPSETIPAIKDAGLDERHFRHGPSREVFKALLERQSDDPVALVTAAKAAGWPQGDEDLISPVAIYARARINDIITARDKERLALEVQDIIGHPERYADAATMSEFVADAASRQLRSARRLTAPPILLADIPEPVREEENPSALFRNGWLRKGGGVVLTAQSGVGKSVIVLQMSYAWSIGRPCFGIEPLRPLKVGIIQFEDDADEMATFRSSMRRGYGIAGWSDKDLLAAERNIHWERDAFVGQAGDSFCSRLRAVQRLRRYDLVIVNPLQSCFGADISKNSDVSHFFREGIDPIIKDAENGCGIMFIHHTNKPQKDTNGNRVGMDAASPYEGAGGAEIVNWERAALNIVRCEKVDGFFLLVAAKRHDRLGWIDDEGCKTRRKVIAHSEGGLLFWREPSQDEIPAGVLPAPKVTADATSDAAELAARCKAKPCLATELREIATADFGRARGRRAFDELTANVSKYGITSRQGPARRTAYGTKDGCETLLKYHDRDGKEA